MYAEKMLEFDSNYIESWREDAANLTILVSHHFLSLNISSLTILLYDRVVWSQRPSQHSWHSLIFHSKQILKMSPPSTSLNFIRSRLVRKVRLLHIYHPLLFRHRHPLFHTCAGL